MLMQKVVMDNASYICPDQKIQQFMNLSDACHCLEPLFRWTKDEHRAQYDLYNYEM